MADQRQKPTGLNNVSETWDQNEQKRDAANAANPGSLTDPDQPAGNDLEQVIKEEAAAYDNGNKEDRLLGGDRATRNDEANDTDQEE